MSNLQIFVEPYKRMRLNQVLCFKTMHFDPKMVQYCGFKSESSYCLCGSELC